MRPMIMQRQSSLGKAGQNIIRSSSHSRKLPLAPSQKQIGAPQNGHEKQIPRTAVKKPMLPPKVQMMPSMRRKHESQTQRTKATKFIQKGFPKGVLLEIGLFLCTARFKVAFKYMRVCKTIYTQCKESQKFWYYLYVQRYPRVFIQDYYDPLVGIGSVEIKDDLAALEYLKSRTDGFFDFEPRLREVKWRELFLTYTCK